MPCRDVFPKWRGLGWSSSGRVLFALRLEWLGRFRDHVFVETAFVGRAADTMQRHGMRGIKGNDVVVNEDVGLMPRRAAKDGGETAFQAPRQKAPRNTLAFFPCNFTTSSTLNDTHKKLLLRPLYVF